MGSSGLSYEIKPLLESDCLELVKVHYRAFEKAAGDIFFTSPPSDSSYELMSRVRAKWISKSNVHAYRAVDLSSNQMLGALVYVSNPDGVSQEKLDDETPSFEAFAPEQNEALWRGIGKKFKECYRDYVGARPAVEVLMLLVDPRYHRQGIGSALLDVALEEADRIGCLTYVDATDEGVRTYEKAGFKIVGNIGFDTRPFGITKRFPVDTVGVNHDVHARCPLIYLDYDTGSQGVNLMA